MAQQLKLLLSHLEISFLPKPIFVVNMSIKQVFCWCKWLPTALFITTHLNEALLSSLWKIQRIGTVLRELSAAVSLLRKSCWLLLFEETPGFTNQRNNRLHRLVSHLLYSKSESESQIIKISFVGDSKQCREEIMEPGCYKIFYFLLAFSSMWLSG